MFEGVKKMKLFNIFMLMLFIIGFSYLVSARSVPCIPDDYDYCGEDITDQYPPAYAHTKIEFRLEDLGNRADMNDIEGYAIKKLFIKYNYIGDQLYFIKNLNSFRDFYCDDYGCGVNSGESDIISSSDNTYPLASLGQEWNGCISLGVWDKDVAGGYIAVASSVAGFPGTNCNWKVVECYDDSDCDTEETCDKSGNWNEWNCKNVECNDGEEKCEGNILFTCESNHWVNKGVILGKCGAQCIDSSTCGPTIQQKFCKDKDLMQHTRIGECVTGICQVLEYDETLETCENGCSEGVCIIKPTEDGGNGWILFIIIGVVAIIILKYKNII